MALDWDLTQVRGLLSGETERKLAVSSPSLLILFPVQVMKHQQQQRGERGLLPTAYTTSLRQVPLTLLLLRVDTDEQGLTLRFQARGPKRSFDKFNSISVLYILFQAPSLKNLGAHSKI